MGAAGSRTDSAVSKASRNLLKGNISYSWVETSLLTKIRLTGKIGKKINATLDCSYVLARAGLKLVNIVITQYRPSLRIMALPISWPCLGDGILLSSYQGANNTYQC